jgi:hypothetical protein
LLVFFTIPQNFLQNFVAGKVLLLLLLRLITPAAQVSDQAALLLHTHINQNFTKHFLHEILASKLQSST